MADDVRLTDLQVIQRYSIAVRGETASRDDLIRALRADLDWLQGSTRSRRADSDADDRAARPTSPARRAAPAKRPTARKPAAKATKAAKPGRGGR